MVLYQKEHGSGKIKQPPPRFPFASSEAQTAMKKHGTEKRQKDAHLAGRTFGATKAAGMQIAKKNGWTESELLHHALSAYVENTIGEKLGALLAATVTDAINHTMKPIEAHIVALIMNDTYEDRESKLLLLEALRASMLPEEFYKLQETIHKKAREA